MAGMERLVIGRDTNASDFLKELRWNDAYYRLANRL
jgi:L-arabinose isomerase